MKKALILGGLGFIGYNLTKELLNKNFNVVVFDRFIDKTRKLPNCEYIEGDFTKIEEHSSIFDGVDVVYHLISTTLPNNNLDKIKFDIETNIIPTVKLLEICSKKKVKKVIYSSSGGTIYGNQKDFPIKENAKKFPLCAYGINKLAIEKYFYMFYKFYGLDYAILRLSNPYGKNHISKLQGAINVFIEKIKNNEPIEIWGDGNLARDYIYIDDVIEAFYLASKINSNEKIFNISSAEETTLNKIIDLLKKISNKDIKVIYKESRNFDVERNCLDNKLAKNVLNREPKVSLEEGISRLLN